MKMTSNDYETFRRLWRMYFPHFTEACGIACVIELLQIHQRAFNSQVKTESNSTTRRRLTHK